MRDNDRIWLDEPEGDDGGAKPRRLMTVLAIAAVPWAIVAGLVLLPDHDPEETPPGREDTVEDTVALEDSDDSADENLTDASRDDSQEAGSDRGTEHPRTSARPSTPPGAVAITPSVEGDPADLERSLSANATVIARAWLTGITPHLEVAGLEPEDAGLYAEHLVVESIERPDPDLAVVTLLAVLLEEADTALAASLHRLAVPLAIDDSTIRPAGTPWWLPAPDLTPVALITEESGDGDLLEAAEAALVSAGYQDIEVIALARSERWPWVADVRATTATGQSMVGPVWLREMDGAFALAGTGHQMADAALDVPGATP